MRTIDTAKQESLFSATIKIVNEFGFAASTIAKIADEAGISQATIYIYHKNKEDLFVSTYMDVKKFFGVALLKDFDETLPVRDCLKKVWSNAFEHLAKRQDYIDFANQFANSPYFNLVDPKETEGYFTPIEEVINRGIADKILKDLKIDYLNVFIFIPLIYLVNDRQCRGLNKNEEMINVTFDMAWDALKL